MIGLLFSGVAALIMGTFVAYPVGLGHLSWRWHLGFGLGGQFLSWLFVTVLSLPYVMRVTVNRTTLFPFWALLGTIMVALVAAILMPAPERTGNRARG